MSQSPKQPDWNHIRAFLATAEMGSLSAAARKLGLTQPTLSRQVSALEEDLGIMLFERVGRSLELTTAGVELLDHTKQMGEAANHFALTASGQSQSIDGEIRITASEIFSAFVLPGFLHELAEKAPKLKIDIVAANDIRDLMRREADIAIRHVMPSQPDLIAKKITDSTAAFYASESYIQKHGRPMSKTDLREHRFVSYGEIDRMLEYLDNIGVHLSEENFHLGSENGLVAWQFSVEGFGISLMDDRIAALSPHMQKLISDDEMVTFPVWLTTHRELHTSRRIRLVFDLLADYLRSYYKRPI